MKIVHIVTGFPLDYPGGITNYVRTLVASQLERGDSVTVVTDASDPAQRPVGMQVISHRYDKLSNFSFYVPSRPGYAQQLVEQVFVVAPDLIHIHSIYGLPREFLEAISASGIPYIVSLHDYYLGCPRIFMTDKWGGICRKIDLDKCSRCAGTLEQSNFIRLAANKLGVRLPDIRSSATRRRATFFASFLKNAASVLPVSFRVQDIFEQVYPKAAYKTIHIGNASADQAAPVKTPSPHIRASFLGTLNKHKGGQVFIDLVTHCRSVGSAVEFHFYGRVEAPYDALLATLGVTNHGPYRPDNLPAIMASTDIGVVVPIWEDNGPQVVMEIMNSNTPIFATRVGGIPDFVAPGAGRLFHPDDPAETRAAFDWLARLTSDELADMRSRIVRLASPQSHASQLRDIYLQIVAQHSRHRELPAVRH